MVCGAWAPVVLAGWLACCAGSLLDEYRAYTVPASQELSLPLMLGRDPGSGCTCRASRQRDVVVCFGAYDCQHFPKVSYRASRLLIKTTAIKKILKKDLDPYYYLKYLEIHANHDLSYIESGAFKNLTNLERLSISYGWKLKSWNEDIFEGLCNLTNLTVMSNAFADIKEITKALKPVYLPKLEKLDISEQVFEKIPSDAFQNMAGMNLTSLNMALSQIDYIDPKALNPLEELKDLYIGENNLNSSVISMLLQESSRAGLKLRQLDISRMGFRKLPSKSLLKAISNTTISILVLARNQFEVIKNDTFPKMEHIEVLDLRQSLIVCIGTRAFSPDMFPKLKVLLLSGNSLGGTVAVHLVPQLQVLDLSNNGGSQDNPTYFNIAKDAFKYSSEMEILDISYNRITTIFNYTFEGLKKLRYLTLQNGSVFVIGPGTFKATPKLEILNLSNNLITSNVNLTRDRFAGLTNLRVLMMNNCMIKTLSSEENIFAETPNLTHLYLRDNQLMFLGVEMLKPLEKLKVLDLTGNLIVTWLSPMFLSTNIRLEELDLSKNKITRFSMTMLRDLDHLLFNSFPNVKIDLSDNIFACECSLLYSTKTWIEANGSVELKKFFNDTDILCGTPDYWEDRKVSEYLSTLNLNKCSSYNRFSNRILLQWLAPIIVVSFLLILIVICVYRYRIHIRYWVFLSKMALGRKLMSKVPKNRRIEEEDKYVYDAFVSYSKEDRDFVLDLVEEMETKPPYLKLCVYERDFQIGSYISEAIMNNLSQSRYILLIVSEHFARSQWCRWETQLAEYHRIFLNDGSCYDPLILVRVGEIQPRYLTPTLKYLLKTKIYLSWDSKDKTGDFWKKIRNILDKNKR